MDNIKKNFSIRDLENISGIKAHTIRIWEKRYNLLSPERSKTNIRYYSHQNLQKLLNIVLLNNNNYKISKISKMSDELINITARDLALNTTINDDAINSLKLSMFKFDKISFNTTYNKLLDKKLIKRYNDSALILTSEMTLEEELAEYLQFILGLNEKKVKEVLGVFHDYT